MKYLFTVDDSFDTTTGVVIVSEKGADPIKELDLEIWLETPYGFNFKWWAEQLITIPNKDNRISLNLGTLWAKEDVPKGTKVFQ